MDEVRLEWQIQQRKPAKSRQSRHVPKRQRLPWYLCPRPPTPLGMGSEGTKEIKLKRIVLGIVAHACNPSIGEVELGRLGI